MSDNGVDWLLIEIDRMLHEHRRLNPQSLLMGINEYIALRTYFRTEMLRLNQDADSDLRTFNGLQIVLKPSPGVELGMSTDLADWAKMQSMNVTQRKVGN